MTGRVTAVVSAYYAEEYLDGRITNLLEQDEHPHIIAIAQKGSKEAEILAGYDKVLTILTNDVPGIYEAWNIGIKAAQTPYITNANCDDRLYPGALKRMADILDKETTYGVVYANQDIVTEIGGDPIGQFTWAEGGLPELMKGCFIGPMPMWRRKLHDRYGYFDENYKSAGDYEYWLRLANGGVKFYHVRDWASGAYLQRKNSVEHREPLRSLWETNNIRMRYREVANV
jgi:glycosyltransferase involved in cell wall biosynthesis